MGDGVGDRWGNRPSGNGMCFLHSGNDSEIWMMIMKKKHDMVHGPMLTAWGFPKTGSTLKLVNPLQLVVTFF